MMYFSRMAYDIYEVKLFKNPYTFKCVRIYKNCALNFKFHMFRISNACKNK